MKQVTIINKIMSLLLFHIIFLIAVNAQFSSTKNASDENLLKPVDSKPPVTDKTPNFIKATLEEKDQDDIKLIWKKTDQLLFNKELLVWGAQCGGKYDLKIEQTEEIADSFVVYQDISHRSAILYSKKNKAIYGNVGTKHYLHGFPVKNLEKKLIINADDSFVLKNPNIKSTLVPGFIEIGKTSPINLTLSNPSKKIRNTQTNDTENILPEKRNKFYLETLLFITYDNIEPIKAEHPIDYLYYILLEYLNYFNAIDLMLGKLSKNFRVNLNLAGIIFEEDEDAFGTMTQYVNLDYSERHTKINLNGFDKIFSRYYQSDPDFVLPDSAFDYVFISTSRGLEYKNKEFLGLSFVPSSLSLVKKIQKLRVLSTPLSVVKKYDKFSDYIIGANEIAHILGYRIDDTKTKGTESSYPENFALKQNSDCEHCLEWNPEVIRSITKFMRKHENRCWLINYPRLHLKNKLLRAGVSPIRQCKCFGYLSYGENEDEIKQYVPEDQCGRPLQCIKISDRCYQDEYTMLPFDGTSCSEDREKICWQGQCVNVSHIELPRYDTDDQNNVDPGITLVQL